MVSIGMCHCYEGFDTGYVLMTDLFEVVQMRKLEQGRNKHIAGRLHIKGGADSYGAFESHQAKINNL